MSKIYSAISRTEITDIRERALAALKEAFAETNVEVLHEGSVYGGTYASIKFQFAIRDGSGMVETRDAMDFKIACSLYGFRQDDLGREFTSRGVAYRIAGLNASAPRFPIKAVRISDGKMFKFSREIAKLLAPKGAAA